MHKKYSHIRRLMYYVQREYSEIVSFTCIASSKDRNLDSLCRPTSERNQKSDISPRLWLKQSRLGNEKLCKSLLKGATVRRRKTNELCLALVLNTDSSNAFHSKN